MTDPAFEVIGDVYRRNAARYADKPALVMPDGRTRSFADMYERATRLGNALLARGLKPGDRVGILSRNRIEYVEGYGVSAAGLIALPLNWRLSPRELQIVLTNAEPAALIVDPSFFPVIEELRGALPFVKVFLALDGDADGFESYDRVVASGSSEPAGIAVSPEATACLLYTSGTTGIPKGAELTHRGLLLNCRAAIDEMFHFTDADVTLAPMPFFHVGGMWYHLFPSFAAGCTTVVMPQFDPQGVLALLARHRVTNTHLVPTMIHALLEQPNIGSFDLSALRMMFYAASSMPIETLKRATATFACDFAQGYGSTEAGTVTCLTPGDHRKARAGREDLLLACGRVLTGIEVKLAVPDNVEDADIGEILVRSPMTMARYWRNPEATAATIRDGWLHTGDLGRIDDEGYLYILDRKSDMIVTGGENVYPREVEDILLQDADILEVAVFDLPDDRWVQKVVAAIVPRSVQLDPEALLVRARQRLAGYKCPKAIFVTDSLPKNAAGKVLRKVLRETYRDRGAER
ncbi:class I adenylate-forming enzyme family protein [Pseudorhodoplanes sp.]|uniref:class I adenylate-forming enzyme family protein n=1 Tax=Pseudorhodoplanes sp. TaxID=1934341 RepID=UPI002C8D6FF0|nr:AMP-binding protein [Pseudorhodoplanes sp.]HWV51525.1 AMP-binding protein [Pseudorhodoplanes sp.]